MLEGRARRPRPWRGALALVAPQAPRGGARACRRGIARRWRAGSTEAWDHRKAWGRREAWEDRRKPLEVPYIAARRRAVVYSTDTRTCALDSRTWHGVSVSW